MTGRARRTAVALLAAINLAITGYAGYGLYTRAGSPEFSRGGEFGGSVTKNTTNDAADRTQKKDAQKRSKARGTDQRAQVEGKRATRATGSMISKPREGTYRYDSSGHEQVHFGFASVCSWDLNGSTSTVTYDDGDVVFDWVYREDRREERHIDEFRGTGVYTVFVGAAVTCAGQRQTTEDHYDPPPLRVPSPLTVGKRWTTDSRTASRRELVTGEVTDHRVLSVPAGRFDAFELTETATVSGGQEGTHTTTFWFAPSLGVIIKQTSSTDVRDGEARFESRMSLALSALP